MGIQLDTPYPTPQHTQINTQRASVAATWVEGEGGCGDYR